MIYCFFCFFLFKQKTAYEMRISDWSSDVCSSDLWGRGNYDGKKMTEDLRKIVVEGGKLYGGKWPFQRYLFIVHATDGAGGATEHLNSTVIQRPQIGRASGRERVCQYV